MTIASLRPASRLSRRHMIAVASGKGGVGKTWLAVTLAHALARLGHSTLLFDGDLGLANVDVQIGLKAARDLGGVINGQTSLRGAALAVRGCGFDVIAGASGTGALALLPAPRVRKLADDLAGFAGGYDRAVIDIGAGLDRPVRMLAARADTCLVVTTDEPTSLTDAYAFVKMMRMDGAANEIGVVVNMAPSERDGERTYGTLAKACESFLDFRPPLLGLIRRDPKVPEAIRAQTPLLVRHPTCDAAADVMALARKLLADAQADAR
ncbi:MAG: MinD/ParA family protein [Gemmatimonas sp.]